MKIVSVVEAKAHLSALLAEVELGKQVAITRHGRVIARLVPDTPRMAAEAFQMFWSDSDIDLEEPIDSLAEPVPAMD